MGQIAGEYDEVGRFGQGVDGGDGLFERPLGVGIGRALESPVRIGKLDEVELIRGLGVRRTSAAGRSADANTMPPKPANLRNSRRSNDLRMMAPRSRVDHSTQYFFRGREIP